MGNGWKSFGGWEHSFIGVMTDGSKSFGEILPKCECPPVPARQHRPYFVNFWLNFAKSLNNI